MMTYCDKCIRLLTSIIVISALAAACGGIPTNHPDLVRARDAYETAKAKPGVPENAPVEMYDAEQALQKAEATEEKKDLKHTTYLAERQAQIAAAAGTKRTVRKEIEKLSKEKDKIILDSRGAEIESKLRIIQEKESEIAQARMEIDKARADAESASMRADELEKELAALNAKPTDRGYVLTLGGLLFAFDKYELLPGAYKTIEQIAAFLTKYPARNVLIEGYTDSTGSDQYNIQLSQRRADSVRVALINRGISMARIITKGYGEAYPVASNDAEAGRQQNRRVEIVFLEEGVRPESKLR